LMKDVNRESASKLGGMVLGDGSKIVATGENMNCFTSIFVMIIDFITVFARC